MHDSLHVAVDFGVGPDFISCDAILYNLALHASTLTKKQIAT